MFWRIIDINEEFASSLSLTKNKRKSGVDKEEDKEEEDKRHSREVLNARFATESSAGTFTMFNLITSTTGERGGRGGGAKNTNNNNNNEVALVSSSSQRAANELQKRKNTSNATTANNVFDSIRGDVNLELRTTQTWGLGLSGGGRPRVTTFGQPSSSMCSIKDAAEKLEQDRKKARQELLLMTQKLEEYEKTERTMGRNLESEREMTSKLRASLNSANRRIGELSERFKAVEGAHEEIRDRLARAEKAEKTCDENLTFAQDALTDRLECDEKYLKALKTSIKERDGLFAANEELVKRVEALTVSERELFEKVEKKEEKVKEILEEKEGALAHLRKKAEHEKDLLHRATGSEKKAMDLKDSFEALLKVNVEKDEALIALRKEKEKATTKNEGELKKLSGELTKLKDTYEKDKLKWCESVDTERLEVQKTKDALEKVSKALETETRQLEAVNATLREKEEQLFEFELERNKAKDALSERENEKKRLEKEHAEKLDDLEEKYEKEKREIREEQNRTVEKTRKQLTEKNAEYISTKAVQNREEIERVKESARKDIDRANANLIAKEEECEKLESEIAELKRDAKLRQTAYEAQLENLQKQSKATATKATDENNNSSDEDEENFNDGIDQLRGKAPAPTQKSALKQRDQQKSTSKSTKSTKFTLDPDADNFYDAPVGDKPTVEKPPASKSSRRRRVTIQSHDMEEGHANENDVETQSMERTATATARKTKKKSEAPTKSKPSATTLVELATHVSRGRVRKSTTGASRNNQHAPSVAVLKKKTPTPPPASLLSHQQRKATLKTKKSPAKNALLRAKILQNAHNDDDSSADDAVDDDGLEGLDPFAFADD